MQPIVSYFMGVNWMVPTWDLFILLFFIIGSLLYGLSLGRDRVLVILVSVYMALAIASNTPALAGSSVNIDLHVTENYVLKLTIFLGMFVVLFFMLSRSALLKTMSGHGGHGPWWQTILFSILQVGLLISITLNFLPQSMTSGLSQGTRLVFMSDNGRSAWMILPIVVMALTPGPKRPDHAG
jgi:hypothetical protein